MASLARKELSIWELTNFSLAGLGQRTEELGRSSGFVVQELAAKMHSGSDSCGCSYYAYWRAWRETLFGCRGAATNEDSISEYGGATTLRLAARW
jgi:hypothetical protein